MAYGGKMNCFKRSASTRHKTNPMWPALFEMRRGLKTHLIVLKTFIYNLPSSADQNVTLHLQESARTLRVHARAATHSPQQLYCRRAIQLILEFSEKSKPIDNLLQNHKGSIANFCALITTWTFNMCPVATMCVPQARIPADPHEY